MQIVVYISIAGFGLDTNSQLYKEAHGMCYLSPPSSSGNSVLDPHSLTFQKLYEQTLENVLIIDFILNADDILDYFRNAVIKFCKTSGDYWRLLS